MRTFFIITDQNIDRKGITEILKTRIGKDFEFINFDDIFKCDVNIMSIEKIREEVEELYRKLERLIVRALKIGRDIVIVGFILLETKKADLPLLSLRFFEIMNIDYIIVVEKEINSRVRNLSEICSMLSGAFIKYIKFDEKNILECVENIADVIKEVN